MFLAIQNYQLHQSLELRYPRPTYRIFTTRHAGIWCHIVLGTNIDGDAGLQIMKFSKNESFEFAMGPI